MTDINQKDSEKGDVKDAADSAFGSTTPGDYLSTNSNEINFEPLDPEDPLQWPHLKKVAIVLNISLLAAMGQMGSSIVAPAIEEIMVEFRTTSLLMGVFVVTSFMLGQSIGLMMTSGLGDVYGRVVIIYVTNVLFVIFAVGSALSTSLGMLIAMRILMGIAASAPPSIGGGIIGDMFVPKDRGRATSLYSLGLIMGPMLGPIIGGFASDAIGWRWVCWILAIAGGVMSIATLTILTETYRPLILERKVIRLRKETGDPDLVTAIHHPGSGIEAVKRSLTRPARLLATSPTILFPSLGLAVLFGMMFMMLATLSTVFQTVYHFSTGVSSLPYLGMGVGFLCGLAIYATTTDRMYRKLAAVDSNILPEIQLAPISFGSPLTAVGLIIYGWGIERALHWMVPIVGAGIFAVGMVAFFMPVTTYLIGVFHEKAAGPVGASAVLRTLVGGLLPLCASSLYGNLGYGWGNTLLAFIALAFAPLPWLFYKNGEMLRKRFPVRD